MRIILAATQPAITSEEIHISDEIHFKQLLSILKDGSVHHFQLDTITTATLLDLNLVHDLGRVLTENGTISVQSTLNLSESDKAFFNFLFAGAYLNETAPNTFTKQTIKTLSLVQVKDLGSVFGEYDFLKQTFKPLQKNKFQDIQQSEELIDEDSLISDTIEIKKVESCATKAKACKNCNCGRKENEQNLPKEELIKQLQEGTIKSSCGSCYLGDAFRCANCPYKGINSNNIKGLPAFKQGEKVQVNNLTEQVVQLEQSNTQIQGGKVKIAL